MAQVKAFKVDGVRMIFHSGDHEPPHFHARRGSDWSARVFFQRNAAEMFDEVKPPGAKIRPADRKTIVEGVEAHRPELLKEWEACQAG